MDENRNPPRPGSTADLSRRVDRLEATTDRLEAAVTEVNHRLDLVNVNQQHQTEMMQAKFAGMEGMLHQTSGEVSKITQLIEAAYRGDPAAQSAYGQKIMQEYVAFTKEVRDHIAAQREHNNAVDDYILVQKTRSETTANLAQRAFGSSLLAALGGIVGLILALIALFGQHPH